MTLEPRLAAHLAALERARRALAGAASREPGRLPEELLDMVRRGADSPLTARDRRDLERRHERRRRDAAAEARGRSTLDLDRARRDGLVEEFARDLPKGAMLHAHLNGTVRPQDFLHMATAVNPGWLPVRVPRRAPGLPRRELAFLRAYPPWAHFRALAPRDRRRLSALVELPPGAVDLRRFEATLGLVSLLEPGPEGSSVGAVARPFLDRCRKHGLHHVEVTRSLPARRGVAARAAAGLAQAARHAGLSARLIWSFPRSQSPSHLLEQARSLSRIAPRPPVAAADLVGSPRSPLLPAGLALACGLGAAGRPALPLVLHAGWNGDPHEVRDAILLGARRLGHALGLARDPGLLEYAVRLGVPVEACPLSNLRRGEVPSLAGHPALTFLRLGLPVSLATDDEGPLGTHISREWAEFIGATDITYDEVRRMVMASIWGSFLDEEARRDLAGRVREELAAFEARWRPRIGRPHC